MGRKLLKIAFQMDRDVVVGRDLSVKFIEEGQRRGHEVFFYQPSDLALSEGKVVAVEAFSVRVEESSLFLHNKVRLFLEELDILFIRQNPPFDMRYITTTYLLERLDRVLLINEPKAIRNCPEKLIPSFLYEFTPPTLITENIGEICAFYWEYGDIVLKPLYGYGGDGVLRICGGTDVGVVSSIMIENYRAPIVAQKFIADIDSDKRVVFLSGKPIGAVRRRVSSVSEIRTNLRVGALPEAVELSERDHEICSAVGQQLDAMGIMFAGIDILGKYLIEINVTSPCGLLEINQVYGEHMERECWDQFECVVSQKHV